MVCSLFFPHPDKNNNTANNTIVIRFLFFNLLSFPKIASWHLSIQGIGVFDDKPTAIDSFLAFQSFPSEKNIETILFHVPTTKPWELVAYVPFGGWNDCPRVEEMMAICKYWFEKYGAIPVTIAHDVMEMRVSTPIRQQTPPYLQYPLSTLQNIFSAVLPQIPISSLKYPLMNNYHLLKFPNIPRERKASGSILYVEKE